jgi:hypothetical protein
MFDKDELRHQGNTLGPGRGSILHPAAQFAEWNHDMLAVGGALLEARIPGGHVGQVRALDVELEIAVERGAGRNIG